jgi:hypothetical protein
MKIKSFNSQKSIIILIILLSLNLSLNLYSQNGISFNNFGTPADNSAILDISSTSQGLLIPRMSTSQRDAINTPATSLLIFNTTTNCFEAYVNSSWYSVSCNSVCIPPPAPVATAAANPGCSSFTANWNKSSGATTYYLDVAIDTSFTDFVTGYNNLNTGNSTSFNVNGLNFCTTYFYRVRAATACISNNSNTISTVTNSASVCWACGGTFTANHSTVKGAPMNKTVTYGTVLTNLTGSNKCWITQNLGADHQASSISDASEASAGWYWQFNHSQGYDIADNGTTRTPNTAWITPIVENSDWLPVNDPCSLLLGECWRIPTYAEWDNVRVNGGWTAYSSDAFNSVLKLHESGGIRDGGLIWRGLYGYYWSSNQYDANYGYWTRCYLNINLFFINVSKDLGTTVRCIQN